MKTESGNANASVRLRIGVTLVLVIGVSVFVHGIHLVDPATIGNTVSKNLHVGSDKSEVIQFLAAQRIAHSEYVPEFRRIYAGISRSSIGLMRGHIKIQFDFDENGKLLSYKVQEVFDSL